MTTCSNYGKVSCNASTTVRARGSFLRPLTRNMFGLRSLVKHFHEFGCTAMMSLFWQNVTQSLWWSVMLGFKSFFHYLLKHDGMIVRLQVYLSSLLLALTSKFHFAKIVITLYSFYKRWELNTSQIENKFLVVFSFSRSYAVLFLVKNLTTETNFYSYSPTHDPGLNPHSNNSHIRTQFQSCETLHKVFQNNNNKKFKHSYSHGWHYLEVFAVVLVDYSKEDAHEDVVTQQDENNKEDHI